MVYIYEAEAQTHVQTARTYFRFDLTYLKPRKINSEGSKTYIEKNLEPLSPSLHGAHIQQLGLSRKIIISQGQGRCYTLGFFWVIIGRIRKCYHLESSDSHGTRTEIICFQFLNNIFFPTFSDFRYSLPVCSDHSENGAICFLVQKNPRLEARLSPQSIIDKVFLTKTT